MKKMFFWAILPILCVFLIVSCNTELDKDISISKSIFINGTSEVDNLLEKYNLSLRSEWFIWNDYMPMVITDGASPSERFSICTIWITSPDKLPTIEVFAKIITNRITIPVLLKDIYDGKGNYGDLYLKDFRPENGFLLNDGEEYSIEIIVKINGEHQTFIFENQIVYVTH